MLLDARLGAIPDDGAMSLALAGARVKGRLGAVVALGGRYRGVDLRRVGFGGLDLRLLNGPRAIDTGGSLPLLFVIGKLGRFRAVSGRLMAEKSSYPRSRPSWRSKG